MWKWEREWGKEMGEMGGGAEWGNGGVRGFRPKRGYEILETLSHDSTDARPGRDLQLPGARWAGVELLLKQIEMSGIGVYWVVRVGSCRLPGTLHLRFRLGSDGSAGEANGQLLGD